MLGSPSITQVLRVQHGLHPLYVDVESITPDHHVVLRNDELFNGAYKGRTHYFLDIKCEGSSYNATAAI
jgi:hypothetical protein